LLQRQPSWHTSREVDAGAGAVHAITVTPGAFAKPMESVLIICAIERSRKAQSGKTK
jgi:hypothetical protein